MITNYVEKIKEAIDKFERDYLKDLDEIKRDIIPCIKEAFEYLQVGTGQDETHELEKHLRKFKNLSQPKDKIADLQKFRSRLRNYLWSTGNPNISLKEFRIAFDTKVYQPIERLINFFQQQRKYIYERVKIIRDNLINIPLGNSATVKDHFNFQVKVIELLAWVFIGQLQLYPRTRLPVGLKIDGAFKVMDTFRMGSEFECPFKNFLVECKNLKTSPKHGDLMQLLTYALLRKDVAPIPAGILVARQKPPSTDPIWKLRKILHRDIRFTVFFFDINDLCDLVSRLKENGDPSYVFKEKLEKLEEII